MITLIPAMDIIGGKCVRLTQGDYDRLTVYNGTPVEVAKAYEDAGCKRLHLVDLDGAKSSHIVNYKVLESIATHTSLEVDFGGGIKSDEDVRIAFESGAKQITGGSIAVKSPETFNRWLEQYGGDKLILGADARNGKVSINGWQEDSDKDVVDFIGEYMERGVTHAICTDINCDGTLQGPAVELYGRILEKYPELYLIASGGIGRMTDVANVEKIQVKAVIVGKALYEGMITLKEVEQLNMTGTCLQNE